MVGSPRTRRAEWRPIWIRQFKRRILPTNRNEFPDVGRYVGLMQVYGIKQSKTSILLEYVAEREETELLT